MRRALLIFTALALAYTARGFLPNHLLVPMDLPLDSGAWKHDPTVRVRVSNTLLSDVPLQLVPWDMAARRHLERGEFPWRNELAGEGEQLFANPLAGLLSPFTWPRLLFGLRGWAWSIFFRILCAALSMYWLARACGCDASPSILSGVVYALSGYCTVWAHYPQTNLFAVLPALAAAALLVSRERSTRNVLLAGAMAALATAAGHPETLFVGVVAVVIFVLCARERVGRFLAPAFAGFLLIGVQLVPFVIVLSRSHVVMARTAQLALRFRKLSVASLILPGYLGTPLRGELDLTGLVPIAENFHQRNGAYIGALALLAIALSFRSLPPLLRRGVWIALASLALSLSLPGLAHVVRFLPLMKWVAVEYFAVPFVLFASLAAGPAVFALPSRRRAALALIAVASLLLIAGSLPLAAPSFLVRFARSGIAHLQQSGLLHQPSAVYEARLAGYLAAAKWMAVRRFALPALCWLAFAFALFAQKRALTVAAVVAELVAFGYGYSPAIRIDEVAPEPAAIAEIKRRDPQHQWLIAAPSEVFAPNLGTVCGLHDAHAYDILTSEAETRRLLPTGYDPFLFGLPPEPSDTQLRALAALGVRYWIGWEGVRELPAAAPPAPARNDPPDGLGAGIVCSLCGAALLVALAAMARRDAPYRDSSNTASETSRADLLTKA